jgi:RNA polymerase sigma-70 factor (ECF subfamily)
LFLAHADFVWRVLRRYGVSESDAEDLSQEVFLVAHRRLREFEGRSHVRTWLYEIARRSALAQRRRWRRADHAIDPEHVQGSAPSPEQAAEHKRAKAWLDMALANLDEDKREAFVLYELEELTLAEVSEALGVPINTLHYRIKTAREQLMRSGGQAHPGSPPRGAASEPSMRSSKVNP